MSGDSGAAPPADKSYISFIARSEALTGEPFSIFGFQSQAYLPREVAYGKMRAIIHRDCLLPGPVSLGLQKPVWRASFRAN